MMDINEIREYLPHRYPFLLVDRVVDLDLEGKQHSRLQSVSINEPFFNGSLPEHPDHAGRADHRGHGPGRRYPRFKMMGVKPADGTLYYFVGSDKLRFPFAGDSGRSS